jgi:hypothetical protein
MNIQWHKIYNMFLPALAVVMAGFLSVQSASGAQKTSREAGRSQVYRDDKFAARTAVHQPGHDADLRL